MKLYNFYTRISAIFNFEDIQITKHKCDINILFNRLVIRDARILLLKNDTFIEKFRISKCYYLNILRYERT